MAASSILSGSARRRGFAERGTNRVDQLGPAAIIDGETKAHAGVVLTEPDGFVDLFQDAIRQVGRRPMTLKRMF